MGSAAPGGPRLDAVGIGVAVRDVTVLLEAFPAPETKTRALGFAVSGGGPVPTALVTLARLGARTALVSVVGDDPAGRRVLGELRREGVDVSACAVRTGFATPASVVLVERGGRRAVCEWGQAGLPLGVESVSAFRPALEACRCLLVDARLPDLQVEAARIVRSAGGRVVLDCGHPRPGVETLLGLSDVAILSHSYARALRGEGFDPEAFVADLAEALPRDGPRIAGLTLGPSGCVISWDGGEPVRVKAPEVAAVDTTGAGDVFHGAFVHALLRGEGPAAAARFACAAAALKCEGLTGRAPLPPEAAIRALAESLPG
jgi:ribokinase